MPTWRSASRCESGQCVQVAYQPRATGRGDILVRDSKYPGQNPLRFTAAEWTAFLDGAKAGEFDPPTLTCGPSPPTSRPVQTSPDQLNASPRQT